MVLPNKPEGRQLSTIEILEEEAKRHFETKRYADAAKTYEHLLRRAAKTSDFDLKKIVHYGLEAAKAWNKTNTPEKRAAVLFSIGTECIKVSAQLFEQNGRQKFEKNPTTAAGALKRAATSYGRLGNFEKQNKLLEEAGEIFITEAIKSEASGDTPESVVLFERASDSFKAAGKEDEVKAATFRAILGLVQLEKEGTLSLSGEGYLRVADLLESVGEDEMAAGYREVAKKLVEDQD